MKFRLLNRASALLETLRSSLRRDNLFDLIVVVMNGKATRPLSETRIVRRLSVVSRWLLGRLWTWLQLGCRTLT